MNVDRDRRVPLYRQCAELVLEGIQKGRYRVGENLPSERDLSRQLGVNRLTLRQGIRELVLRGLLEKNPCSGTRVIRNEATKPSSKAIGCLVFRKVGSLPISPYYAEIYRGIQEELVGHGYDLMLDSVSDEDLYTWDGRVRVNPGIISNQFSGVILTGGLPDELGMAYRAKGMDVVLIDKDPPNPSFSAIVPDHYAGAYELGKYLCDQGHKRIGFLVAPPDPVVDARVNGFSAALREDGVFFLTDDCVVGDYESKFSYPAMMRYLERRKSDLPTAWAAINDEAAFGVMRALREKGFRIPEDVSVAGFDDIPEAALQKPPMTTVRIRLAEMGRLAARTLIQQMQSPRFAPVRITLKPELIVRESVTRIQDERVG